MDIYFLPPHLYPHCWQGSPLTRAFCLCSWWLSNFSWKGTVSSLGNWETCLHCIPWFWLQYTVLFKCFLINLIQRNSLAFLCVHFPELCFFPEDLCFGTSFYPGMEPFVFCFIWPGCFLSLLYSRYPGTSVLPLSWVKSVTFLDHMNSLLIYSLILLELVPQ